MAVVAATELERSLYKEMLPTNYLSKTFQSNVLFSPGDTTRRTISTEKYVMCNLQNFHTESFRLYNIYSA